MRNVKIIRLLVGSDVQRTDDDLLAVHLGNHVLIYLELLVLCGIIVAAQVQELAPEQADALGIILQDRVHILFASDIRVQMDDLAALCHRRQALQALEQELALFLSLLLLLHDSRGHFIRLDINLTRKSVHDTFFSRQGRIQIDVCRHNAGNIHHAGQDRCMGIG